MPAPSPCKPGRASEAAPAEAARRALFDSKFIIDKDGRVVERNDQSPKASEAKLKALLGV